MSPVPVALAPAASLSGRPVAPGGSRSPGHIVLIVMENKEYEQIIGNQDAPYLNGLAARFAQATHAYAVAHPSLPNYLALLGGDTFGVTSDCTTCFVDRPNLVDELEAHGKIWRAYMEDLPQPCFLGAAAGDYALKHDPFLYFRDIRDDPARCAQVVPLTRFAADLAAGTLPDFAWVTPNPRHDMHDGSVAEGDRWLAAFVPPILASAAWRQGGLLLITWDEGTSDAGCCDLAAGGHVPTLVIAPSGPAGARLTTPVSHYSILRTIEDAWGLGHLGHSGDPGVRTLLG